MTIVQFLGSLLLLGPLYGCGFFRPTLDRQFQHHSSMVSNMEFRALVHGNFTQMGVGVGGRHLVRALDLTLKTQRILDSRSGLFTNPVRSPATVDAKQGLELDNTSRIKHPVKDNCQVSDSVLALKSKFW